MIKFNAFIVYVLVLEQFNGTYFTGSDHTELKSDTRDLSPLQWKI